MLWQADACCGRGQPIQAGCTHTSSSYWLTAAEGSARCCATHTPFRDVFSAGASHYGVADMELLAKDTHKFESRYLDGLVGPYPEVGMWLDCFGWVVAGLRGWHC